MFSLFILTTFVLLYFTIFVILFTFFFVVVVVIVVPVLMLMIVVISLWKLCSWCMRYCICINFIFSFSVISVLLCNFNSVIYNIGYCHICKCISRWTNLHKSAIDLISSFTITASNNDILNVTTVGVTLTTLWTWIIVKWSIYTHHHCYMSTW